MTRAALSHNEFTYGLFRSLWEESGGVLSGEWRNVVLDPNLEPALVFESLPLSEIITKVNKHSNNVMAKQLLYTLATEEIGAAGTEAKGRQVVEKWLAEHDMASTEMRLANGAGLSRSSRVTAKHLSDLLRYAYASPYMPEYVSSLSLSGMDGTLRRRLHNNGLSGQAHMKTGSLDHVSAIGGYLQSRSGRAFHRRRNAKSHRRSSWSGRRSPGVTAALAIRSVNREAIRPRSLALCSRLPLVLQGVVPMRTAFLFLILTPFAVQAETAYITDNLRLGLHQAADTSDRAMQMLESGQELEILSRDRNYANVRLPNGDEGYVKAAYLVDDKPAKLIVTETLGQIAILEGEIEATKAAFAAPAQTIQRLEEEIAADKAVLAENELAVATLSTELSDYRDRQDQYKYSLPYKWVGGAMLVCLLAGIIAGLWWVDLRSRRRHGGVRIY